MDYDAWIIWAEATGVHTTVTSFLRQRGDFAGSTPERWERISLLLKADSTMNMPTLMTVLRGIIGNPGAPDFINFKRDVDAGKIQLPILGLILPGLFG